MRVRKVIKEVEGEVKKGLAWYTEEGKNMATEEVSYFQGNKNAPVIVLGDDPTNSNNCLIVRLGTSESVAKTDVSDEVPTTAEVVDSASSNETKDAQVARLKDELAAAEAR